MRNHINGVFVELRSNNAETISITPGTASQLGTFDIKGVPPVTDDMLNYAQVFWWHLLTTFDPDAGGNAVNWDKLYKGMASFRLFSPLLGQKFPTAQTRGAVLGHIIQVVGLGYNYPQPARTQIPANTDTDVTLDLFYAAPLAYECLADPQECTDWIGFYDGGVFEGTVDVSSVYDGDYAGAVIKAPTTLRSYVELEPSHDRWIGCPTQWRERQITGGGPLPTLTGVGEETDLIGVQAGCGLAALLWLTDATGIGLSGPDGVDNFTAMEVPWRGQPNLRNLDPLYLNLRKTQNHRVAPVAGTGGAMTADGAGWPTTMAVTTGVDNRPAADAQKLFLPIIYPGSEMYTSKVAKVNGNLPVSFNVTAAISGTHRFVSWELLQYTDEHLAKLAVAMGVDESLFQRRRGSLGNANVPGGKLRYTRTFFDPIPEAVAAAG